MNRYFTKEDIGMANAHMNRHSTPLVSREILMKTTRSHFICTGDGSDPKMTQRPKDGRSHVGKDLGKVKKLSFQWEYKMVQPRVEYFQQLMSTRTAFSVLD